MRELTFFTTNPTKLDHARYIAEGRHIRVKGFRQRTYHADYVEPRLQSRQAVLKASYESAKAQIKKAGFSEASHPFILEDTSVRINALSKDGKEVPGLDIKYWMEDRTFESLDTMLRAAGNDRRATVRSDVLLHIPSSYRGLWSVDDEFLVFVGEQQGSIIETECQFDPNLVYPWLDNRSFNKWFSPDGSDMPLGALSINVADEVDFRRKSFEKLLAFLEERRYFAHSATQFNLHLDRKPNIVLCGYTCSGKTTASQHLARRFGYLHVEASDFMHLSYLYRHGDRGLATIGDFAEKALSQKATIAAEKVVDYILEHIANPVVISGFRSPQEIAFLKDRMKIYGKTFVQRFIVADEQTRFSRLLDRARPGDDLTISEFRGRDLQQKRMGLERIRRSDQCLPLDNQGTIKSYVEHIDQMVGEGWGDKIDVETSLSAMASVSAVGLQDAILIALLTVWKNDEARKFYTTTEVSALIAKTFPTIRPKHKDNVSRYFNQDFYAYYEISDADTKTRKYRLSNTGYGMAIRALRAVVRH